MVKNNENNELTFSPVRTEKTAERILGQIIFQISNKKLKAGDKLPPEKILAKQFEASRPSVREAINTLKVLGLVSVRQGDGAYINGISHGTLAEYFLILNTIGEFTLSEVSEARLVLEPIIGRLAAERATKEDLRDLKRVLRKTKLRIRNKENPSPTSIQFHRVLANSCKNSLLSLILNSVLDVLIRQISKFSSDIKTNEDAYSLHKKVFEAISDKDAEAAAKYIKQDIQITHNNLERIAKTNGFIPSIWERQEKKKTSKL